jgi:UDP-2,4-diacetamido-2,4,6-trideoxy-beta-L-altropyranose hydrolase
MAHHLLVRVDAGARIGIGHFMRCFALAQAWRDAGGTVEFLTHEPANALEKRIIGEGMALIRLNAQAGSQMDLLATTDRGKHASWTLLDGYHFDSAYQQALQAAVGHLLVIDDDGHAGRYTAELVLNQNRHADTVDYSNRSGTTRLLLGLDYVLLRREFTQRIDSPRRYRGEQLRLLVTMGGSDPENATAKVLDSLSALADAQSRVVVGPANARRAALKSRSTKRIQILDDVVDMQPHMEWANLAICSGGSSVWELLFMGTPILVGTLVPVEDLLVSGIADHPAVRPLGPFRAASAADIAAAITSWSARGLPRARHCGEWLVDGRGAERVTNLMKEALIVFA